MEELLSFLYKTARAGILKYSYTKQAIQKRPKDLEAVIDIGDRILKSLPGFLRDFQIPEGIGINFHDMYFPSPLTIASFKEDLDVINIWLGTGFGGACLKTVTHQNNGNKRPRLQEVKINGEYCLLNSMGLPSKDVDKFIEELKKSQIFYHNRPIGLSIGGNTLEEYMLNFLELNNYFSNTKHFPNTRHKIYYEINVSCPNTIYGLQLSENPQILEGLLFFITQCNPKNVIGVKFSPDTPNDELLRYARLLKRYLEYSKTYINLGNTSYRKCTDACLDENALSTKGGGLSGGALYPRTLEMVELVAPAGIPIIATGGINSAEKAKAILDVGKRYDIPILIGVATAVVEDLYFAAKVNRKLAGRG